MFIIRVNYSKPFYKKIDEEDPTVWELTLNPSEATSWEAIDQITLRMRPQDNIIERDLAIMEYIMEI